MSKQSKKPGLKEFAKRIVDEEKGNSESEPEIDDKKKGFYRNKRDYLYLGVNC